MNPTATIEGRLGDDPELRFTPSGKAVANLRLVTSDRKKVGDEWQDENTTWWNATVWESMAENVAESLQKGDLVIIHGKIYMREYEAKDGSTGKSLEIKVFSIGPALRYATAKISKTKRSSGASTSESAKEGGTGYDPWATTGHPANQQGDEPPY